MQESQPDFSQVTQVAIQDELESQSPEDKKELTEADMRKIRKVYFTQQYGKVSACGHRFHPLNEPQHRNCQPCWFAYFNTHGELTKAVDEFFREHDADKLTQIRGAKFTKMFLGFMGTLAQLREINESSTTGAIGDNNAVSDGAGEDNSDTGRSSENNNTADSSAVQI